MVGEKRGGPVKGKENSKKTKRTRADMMMDEYVYMCVRGVF